MICVSCSNPLSVQMRVALLENKCPFCGRGIFSERLVKAKLEIMDIVANNPLDKAADIILIDYVIGTRQTDAHISGNDIVVSTQDVPNNHGVGIPATSNPKREAIKRAMPDTSEMSDDERTEAEEAWRLMEEGNADAFFYPDGGSQDVRHTSRPPIPENSGQAVRGIAASVARSHAQSGGDIPEGFEDPSLLPQKGSNRINRV